MITGSPPRWPHFRFNVDLGRVEVRLRRSVNEKARIDPEKGRPRLLQADLARSLTAATRSLRFRIRVPFRSES